MMIKMHLTGQKISYIKATSLVKNNDYLFNYMHKFCLLSKTNTVTNVHNSISTHTHQCTHACTRTRTHTHTCTHTHTHTHKQASKQLYAVSHKWVLPASHTHTLVQLINQPRKKNCKRYFKCLMPFHQCSLRLLWHFVSNQTYFQHSKCKVSEKHSLGAA